MENKPQTIVIPLCDDFDSALKYISFLNPDLTTLKIIFVYAISPSKIFGTNKRRIRLNISSNLLKAMKLDVISMVETHIQESLPGILPEQFSYRFEIGSWGEVIEKIVKNEKCDLLLLGYKKESIINRLFGGLYASVFQIPSITTLVVKMS